MPFNEKFRLGENSLKFRQSSHKIKKKKMINMSTMGHRTATTTLNVYLTKRMH